MNVKRFILMSLPISAGLIILCSCSHDQTQSFPTLQKESVIVSSSIGDIKKEEFYEKLKQTSGEDVLRDMLYEKLLRTYYKVDKKEVDAEVEKLRNEYHVSTNKELNTYLNKHYQQTLSDVRKEIEISQLSYQAITDGVRVSEDEIKQRYEVVKTEIKARHVLVKTVEEANLVIGKLKAGEDFSQVARDFSVDTKTANNGGDLGYFNKENSPNSSLTDAAFQLKTGDISSPILSSDGYHVIVVEDKRTLSYEVAKPSIEKELLTRKAKTLDEAIQELQKKANIKINDPELLHTLDPKEEPVG